MKSVEKLPSRYRIDGKLGEGGFGTVYKAYDSQLKLTLAIKIFPDNATSTQETLTSEFRTLSQLQHPNLVKVFDYGTLPPHTPYFTMELVEGQNLREYFRNRTNISSVTTIIRQVLKALAYLHKNQMLHGDIKPENVVIAESDRHDIEAKLLDFGLAMSLGEERKLKSGTLRYLAPEILYRGLPNSPATDLYALGVSLIESVLSTEVPGSNEINEAFFENTYVELNRTLASVGIRNPSALSAFILDLCRIDPSERMQDAKEAIKSFAMIADELAPKQEIQMNSIFVGRTGELGEIERCLADAGPAKRAIVLFGPRGIGKKSIIGKAAQNAQLKGFLPIDLTPFSLHFSLDQFINALSIHLSTTERKRFLSRLPARTESRTKYKDTNLDANRASVIYAHIIQFLAEMSASQPILIMAADIERSSKDFLLFIVQLTKQMELSGSGVNLLITTSSDFANQAGLGEELSRIGRSPLAAVIEVPPFNDKLLKQYLMRCFGQPLLPEKERQDILSRTRGLPLLIVAFLKSLLATKAIQNEEGHWILDRRLYKQAQIPTDIDDSFSIAIRDVSKEEEALLRILAIFDRAVAPGQLESLTRSIIDDPLYALANLLKRTILVYRSDGAISFAHPLYAQFTIENTPSNILRDYSGLLADCLVSGGSNDSLRIGRLYVSAERVEEALLYGFAAVDKMYSSYLLYDCLKLLLDLKELASRKGSKSEWLDVLDKLAPVEHATGLPREAITDYCALVDYAQSDSRKAAYFMHLADVHYGLLGNVKESETMLQKALRSAKKAGNSDLIAAIYHKLGELLPDKSIPFFEEAAALSKKTNTDLYLTSLAHLAYTYQVAGEPSKASRIERTVVRELREASLTAKRDIYSSLYLTSFYSADYRAARLYVMKKIQIEKKTENSLKLVSSMSSLGGCFYTEGSFYKMIDTLKEAYHAALKYSNYLSAITILSNLSLGYRSVADYGLSLKIFVQAQEMIRREGIQALNSAFLVKPMMLYLMFGEAQESEFRIWAEQAEKNSRRTNNRIGLGHHSMAFAMHHLYKLEHDEALIHAKKALSHFKHAADRDDVVSALAHIAIIQLAMGKLKPARTNLEQAEEIYEAIHCEYLKPLLMLAKAILARFEQAEDAKKILTDALRTSKKMGTRETTWQVQREFALFHKDRGEPHKALAHYRDAVETIKQITETIDEEELKMSYLEVPFRRRVFDEIKNLKREAAKTQ